MLVQTTNSLRVAVLGSGIAGSTAARTLADHGVKVTVFEAGYGMGGRTSTRVMKRDGTRQYQFDHGAQYIGRPETEAFRECLEGWKSDGWVAEWSGKFATVKDTKVVFEDEDKDRWVGYPRMNCICESLLNHENIGVTLQTRAEASHNENNGWDLRDGKTKGNLGTFDWLISSDRNSGANHRKDLSSADVEKFTTGVRDIQSVKSLTAMVLFEEPLDINVDGVKFTGTNARFGSLGWVARDTSKPGRERNDGEECWVLQSHPDAAKELLKGKHEIDEIRQMAKDVLVNDFLKAIPHLGTGNDVVPPPIVTSIGHRWGAAFPIPSQEFIDMESQIIASKQFVAAGDYFGKLSGRIEGAYLSGRSAANEIIRLHDKTK